MNIKDIKKGKLLKGKDDDAFIRSFEKGEELERDIDSKERYKKYAKPGDTLVKNVYEVHVNDIAEDRPENFVIINTTSGEVIRFFEDEKKAKEWSKYYNKFFKYHSPE